MFTCPNCNRPGVSVARKMCLGPAIPATCTACGKKVGVPWFSVVAVFPALGAAVCAGFVDGIAVKALLLAIGFALMSIIHMAWIPLVPR